MPYCRSCIDNDFVSLVRSSDATLSLTKAIALNVWRRYISHRPPTFPVWIYGTVQDLTDRQDFQTCNLCRLIWTAMDKQRRSIGDESLAQFLVGKEEWLIKLQLHEEIYGFFAPSAVASWSLQISILPPDVNLKGSHRETFSTNVTVHPTIAGGWEGDLVETVSSVHSASDVCFDMLTKCLKDCRCYGQRERSDDYGREPRTPLPDRVLEIRDAGDQIRLLDRTVTDNMHQRYAALTYCWGDGRFLQTTAANFEQHCTEISLAACPQTVKDGVFVCNKLGIKYLWVDSLCILQGQDDVAEADFMQQAPKMAQYYGMAYVTLVAASARDAHEGFLQSRWDQQKDYVIFDRDIYKAPDTDSEQAIIGRTRELEVFVAIPDPQNKPAESHVDSRAWCLQEIMLSRRIISYQASRIVYTCRCGTRTENIAYTQDVNSSKFMTNIYAAGASWKESIYIGLNSLNYREEVLGEIQDPFGVFYRDQRQAAMLLWAAMIRNYTRRQLTYRSDVLPAVAGIAAMWQSLFHQRYAAGLWQEDICVHMLWTTEEAMILQRQHDEHSNDIGNRLTYKADDRLHADSTIGRDAQHPSWSWASLNAPVLWPFPVPFYRKSKLAKVTSIRMYEYDSPDDFAKSSRGQIDLEARTSETVIHVEQVPGNLAQSLADRKSGVYIDQAEDKQAEGKRIYVETARYECLAVKGRLRSTYKWTSWGVVVVPCYTCPKESEVDGSRLPTYQRIGVFWMMQAFADAMPARALRLL